MPTKATEKVKKIRADQLRGKAKKSDIKDGSDSLSKDSLFQKRVVDQVQNEYDICYQASRSKITEALNRLRLYNNQRRDKNKVGDPMLFTIFQTVFASLQDDKLAVQYLGREEGDEEMAENLQYVAENDYDEMWKFQHDYDWNFDALFFGRSISYFNEFDFETLTPIPEVWDILTFLRDPFAISVNGNRLGRGGMRFGGREVFLSMEDMKDNPEYFNLEKLKGSSSNFSSLVSQARQARRDAQGQDTFSNDNVPNTGDSDVLQWLTHIDGEKYIVELGNDRTLLIRATPLVNSKNGSFVKLWPLIDRTCYPIAHDWDGVSIPDIVEDKQRYRAALLNLIGEGAQADVYPMRLYDTNRIKKSIDKNYAFGKWIPVNGPVGDASHPLQPAGNIQKAQFVLDFLDASAQKALATPDLQSGALSSQTRSATELNLVSSKVETRYSLTARIFGESEKMFWRRHYEIYDERLEDGIHKKAVRIGGTFGPTWRGFKRNDLITSHFLGPDIKIESRTISEARKTRKYQTLSNYALLVLQDPSVDRLYLERALGKLILPRDEVERILPDSIDEIEAKEENEKLNNGEFVKVLSDQNHNVHLRIHAYAKDGPEKDAHVKAHRMAIMMQKARPELFPQQPEQKGIAMGQTPQLGSGMSKASEGAGSPIIQ